MKSAGSKTPRRGKRTLKTPGRNSPRQRIQKLTDLLEAIRNLSNILSHRQLYTALINLVREWFAVEAPALLVYDSAAGKFRRAPGPGADEQPLEFAVADEGLWDAIRREEPFEVKDARGRRLFEHTFADDALSRLPGCLWVPMVMRGEVIGLLALGEKRDGRSFDEFERLLLKQIAAHAAVCINTCRLYEERKREKEDLDKTLQNLSLLYSIGKAMNYISDLKNLLQFILSQAIEITSAEKGSIMLYDPESDRLNVRVLAGPAGASFQEKVNNNEIECRSFRPGEGIAGRVFLTARPIIVNDTAEDELFVQSETSYVRSIACIPMVVYSDVIGVINVTNKLGGQHFTEEDLQMLKAVADQAAVAVNKAQLWNLAVTDSLTGLYVRRYFMAKFQEELRRADRYGKALSVVMADLDRFKRINDTYGHDAGDRVLQTISTFLKKNIREVDLLARYGGEEFVLMIPEADADAAFCLSERLREKFSHIKLEGLPQITISLGIASYPQDGTRVEELIKKADAAMYAAKEAGRNRVVKYSEDIRLVRDGSHAN